jgi:predicted dehydrogenase
MADGSDRPLGVAVLGFGFIGRVHAYGHVNIPLFYDPPPVRTRLVGVATRRQATAEKAKAQYGFEVACTDQLALIGRDDVDIVHICTPNDLHLPALLAAMKAGKHIYCDKPLVATTAEADRVEAALADYHGTGQMTLQYRFLPATLRAKQLMEAGRVGAITHLRAAYLHSGSVDRGKALNWKADASKGGGVIGDLLSHVVDLMWHLAGPVAPVHAIRRVWSAERVSAEDASRRIGSVGEDFAGVTVQAGDGAPGWIEASKIATGAEDELRFEIHGDRGAVRFNLMEPNWLEFYDLADAETPVGGERGWRKIATVSRYPKPAGFPGPKFTPGWLRAHMACLHHFLAAVAAGERGEPSLAHGVALQRLLGEIQERAVAI